MRKKTTLNDVLGNSEIKWDPDSKILVWKQFYIPYYRDSLEDVVDFNNLGFVRGKFYRVFAPVKIEGYEDIRFGGDVIINDKSLENKYEYWNLGLLPILGNLQGVKKRYGNDKKISEFIKKIDEYYHGKNDDMLIKIGRSKGDGRKKTLELLGMTVKDGKCIEPQVPREKTYNCCYKLYGVNKEIVKRILNDSNEGDVNKAFWTYRKERWLDIQKRKTGKINNS